MSTTLNPLIQALFNVLAPILLVIVLHLALRAMMPLAVKLLGQKNALALQERVDRMAQPAIAYAVATGSAEIGHMGPMTVESRNLMVGLAVRYFVDHAPELAAQAGEYVQGSEGQIDEQAGLLFQKLLARFDAHPAVQGLIGNVPPGDVPATVGG